MAGSMRQFKTKAIVLVKIGYYDSPRRLNFEVAHSC